MPQPPAGSILRDPASNQRYGLGSQVGVAVIRSGVGVPANSIGADGDWWLRVDGGPAAGARLYIRVSGAYTAIAGV